jgi:hypothetical protein
MAAKLMESALAFARTKEFRIVVDDFWSVWCMRCKISFLSTYRFCIWVSLLTSCTWFYHPARESTVSWLFWFCFWLHYCWYILFSGLQSAWRMHLLGNNRRFLSNLGQSSYSRSLSLSPSMRRECVDWFAFWSRSEFYWRSPCRRVRSGRL